MLKTYKGRYEYGKLIFPGNTQILMPDTADIIITILDETTDGMLSEKQRTVARNFLKAVENIKEEDFTEEDKEAFARWDSGEYRVKFEERLP